MQTRLFVADGLLYIMLCRPHSLVQERRYSSPSQSCSFRMDFPSHSLKGDCGPSLGPHQGS